MSLLFRMNQPEALVDEMVNALPEHLFTSSTTTFCDPAMGKGDYLVGVAKRLIKYGHTRDNILSRLYGYEMSQLYINACENMTPLKGAHLEVMTYDKVVAGGIKMKFDCVIGNPPYNKQPGDKEPIYYQFLRNVVESKTSHWAIIIPCGWLVGPRSKHLRQLVFGSGGVHRINFKGSGAFNGQVNQNTVVVYGDNRQHDTIVFTRVQNGELMTSTIRSEHAIIELPMVFGQIGQQIWDTAKRYHTHFSGNSKLASDSGICVSGGNGFGSVDETATTLSEAARRAVMPVYAVTSTKVNYLHHDLEPHQVENAMLWLRSKLFGILFMTMRTTHRTIKANIGRMPLVIVDGEYSDETAYRQLGLTDEQIRWIEETV